MLIPIFPDRLWKVRLRWTKPRSYELTKSKRARQDGTAHFYMILGKKHRSAKLLYLGKTYVGEVWMRLRNPDHQRRLQKLRTKFPGYRLFVSHGVLDLNYWKSIGHRYPSRKRIDEIESLL